MKASRLLWLVWMILTVVRSVTLGQDAPAQPDVTRALLQAKTVYIISGHVRYYKTKGLFKKELVDTTPFEEPCRKNLEKWGRFTLVSDIKGADLVIRAYEKGQSNYRSGDEPRCHWKRQRRPIICHPGRVAAFVPKSHLVCLQKRCHKLEQQHGHRTPREKTP